MSWRGPALDDDQHDLVQVVDALATARRTELSDDDPDGVAALVTELAGMGLWSLGVDEVHGGGGADWLTTLTVFEALGRHWPALGWAAVQAHAAAPLLAASPLAGELLDAVHAGAFGVAVLEADAARVHATDTDGRLQLSIDRVDACSTAPLVVLLDESGARLIHPRAITAHEPRRRTGLDGARTVSLSIDATSDQVHRVTGDASAVRRTLWLGAAAVLAGISAAAADDAVAYAAARHQFGGPLTDLPAVRQTLLGQAARTTVALRASAAEATTEAQAWAVLSHAGESAISVAADALQSHGGYGYLREYLAERRLRDAVSLRAAADAVGFASTIAQREIAS